MSKKPTYRIRNWAEYNTALVQRGSITLWFEDKAIESQQFPLLQQGAETEILKELAFVDFNSNLIPSDASLTTGFSPGPREEVTDLSSVSDKSRLEFLAGIAVKRIFGGDFRSKELSRQKAELYAKSLAMNKMTRLGMPKGTWIASYSMTYRQKAGRLL